MYESPIKIIESAIDSFQKGLIKEKEDAIIFAVKKHLGVEVDEGELLRALQYDRFQYDKGYADAMASIVRCKDCDFCYYNSSSGKYRCSTHNGMNRTVEPDEFCSYGERREGE